MQPLHQAQHPLRPCRKEAARPAQGVQPDYAAKATLGAGGECFCDVVDRVKPLELPAQPRPERTLKSQQTCSACDDDVVSGSLACAHSGSVAAPASARSLLVIWTMTHLATLREIALSVQKSLPSTSRSLSLGTSIMQLVCSVATQPKLVLKEMCCNVLPPKGQRVHCGCCESVVCSTCRVAWAVPDEVVCRVSVFRVPPGGG